MGPRNLRSRGTLPPPKKETLYVGRKIPPPLYPSPPRPREVPRRLRTTVSPGFGTARGRGRNLEYTKATATLTRVLAICNQGFGRSRE
jgi:hypothetical protein